MNLGEGVRRLAIVLGIAGAIAGGVLSYSEWQSVADQRADHVKFEQLANSQAMKQERDRRFPPGTRFDMDEAEPIAGPHNPKAEDGYAAWPSEVGKDGIKRIYWSRDLNVISIDTEDGRTLYSASDPSRWAYAIVPIMIIVGFVAPWGVVRIVGWVLIGFFPAKA